MLVADKMETHFLHSTHWGRVTHICVNQLTIIGSNNGLSPGRRQAIIWTNAGILLIGPLGTNFSEILIEIHTFSFKNTQRAVARVVETPVHRLPDSIAVIFPVIWIYILLIIMIQKLINVWSFYCLTIFLPYLYHIYLCLPVFQNVTNFRWSWMCWRAR